MESRECLFFIILLSMVNVHALDNGLSVRPPRGWLAWERFACTTDCDLYPDDCISEKLIKAQADRLAADGYLAAGYEYIGLDDCWMLHDRDPVTQMLVADPKRFPSGIAALADYVHSRGLKLGIYLDHGTKTCGGYAGSLFYMQLDAQTIADWRVDLLKLDSCYADSGDMEEENAVMEAYLNRTGRPIYFLCCYPLYMGLDKVNVDLLKRTCNSWRMYHDIEDSYESVRSIINLFGDDQNKVSTWGGPNHWNDGDMLMLGNFGLSYDQQRMQMAMWCMLGSPLFISADLRNMESESRDLLTHKRLLAISADPLGKPAARIYSNNGVQVFSRPLALPIAGSFALALLDTNTFGPPNRLSFRLADLGLTDAHGYNISEGFTGAPLGTYASNDSLVAFVTPSGIQLVIATPVHSTRPFSYRSTRKRTQHVLGLLHGHHEFPQYAGLDPQVPDHDFVSVLNPAQSSVQENIVQWARSRGKLGGRRPMHL